MTEHKTILIVDDEIIIAMNEAIMLERNGYNVITAINAEKALKAVDENTVDLILMDIDLGFEEMDGIEVARRILIKNNIPIVFISSHTEREVIEKTEEITSYGYIVKGSVEAVQLTSIKMAFKLFEANVREKVKEKKLQESLERYQTLFDDLADPVLIFMDEFPNTFLDCNHAVIEKYGYTREEILKMNPNSLQPSDGFEDMLVSIQSGKPLFYEAEHFDKNGRKYFVDIHSRPIKYKGMNSHINIIRDITKRKNLEKHIRQSEKMESIGHLAGGIAHDFNNLLTVIIGYAALSQNLTTPGSRLEKYIKHIFNTGEKAKELVNQILTFSRQNPDIRSAILLKPVIDDIVQLLRASIPSSIEIRLDLSEDTKPVLADSTKIHEVLLNLCTNAVNAMKEIGELEITLREKMIEEEFEGRIGLCKAGLYSVISIIDDGSGMHDVPRP